jgi:hypothetical protein
VALRTLRFGLVLFAVPDCSAQTYILATSGSPECNTGSVRLTTQATCEAAIAALGYTFGGVTSNPGPPGCFYMDGAVTCCPAFWNSDPLVSDPFSGRTPICLVSTPTPTPAPTACSPVPSATRPANVPSTHVGFITISGVFFALSDSTTSSYVSDQLSLYVVLPYAAPCDRRSIGGIGRLQHDELDVCDGCGYLRPRRHRSHSGISTRNAVVNILLHCLLHRLNGFHIRRYVCAT